MSLTVILPATLRKNKFYHFASREVFKQHLMKVTKIQKLIDVNQLYQLSELKKHCKLVLKILSKAFPSKMIKFCFREKFKLPVFKISELDEKDVQGMERYKLTLNNIVKKNCRIL